MTTNLHSKGTFRPSGNERTGASGRLFNDNISTIYVLDESLKFAGAIDLKDLIIARKHDVLDDIVVALSIGNRSRKN